MVGEPPVLVSGSHIKCFYLCLVIISVWHRVKHRNYEKILQFLCITSFWHIQVSLRLFFCFVLRDAFSKKLQVAGLRENYYYLASLGRTVLQHSITECMYVLYSLWKKSEHKMHKKKSLNSVQEAFSSYQRVREGVVNDIWLRGVAPGISRAAFFVLRSACHYLTGN